MIQRKRGDESAKENVPLHERESCRAPRCLWHLSLSIDAPPQTCQPILYERSFRLRIHKLKVQSLSLPPTPRNLLASPGSVQVDQALDHASRVAKDCNLWLILHVFMNRSGDAQNCPRVDRNVKLGMSHQKKDSFPKKTSPDVTGGQRDADNVKSEAWRRGVSKLHSGNDSPETGPERRTFSWIAKTEQENAKQKCQAQNVSQALCVKLCVCRSCSSCWEEKEQKLNVSDGPAFQLNLLPVLPKQQRCPGHCPSPRGRSPRLQLSS